MPAEQLIQWVRSEENGLKQVKEISGFRFALQYKPVDYLLAQELLSGRLTQEKAADRRKELEGMHYFDLDISTTDKMNNPTHQGLGSSLEVQGRLNYFSFGMKDDLKLECNGKQIPCGLFHYERSSDVGPSRKFLIAFPRSSETGDLTLVLDSDEFGAGKVNIGIEQSTLDAIPTLED